MKNTLIRASVILSGSSGLFVAGTDALAETRTEESTQIETIEVIGTRQAYRGDFAPLETPQVNLEIDAETLKNAGALDLSQALDLSASVARQNNFGGLWNSFAVRGFVGDENLPSNYLVNGFNAGRGFGGPRDLSGIESVEVLKGPRAALFGRGEPGGTINLVTKRPTFEKNGEVTLSAGSFNTYRTDVDWTSPVSEDVAIRLVGFYEDAESFRDTVETEKYGFSSSIAWNINEQSKLVYELEYSQQEIPFDRGVIEIDGELGKIPSSRFLGEPSYGPIETDVVGHQFEYQRNLNEDWAALVGFNYRETSLEGLASENGFGAPDDAGNFGRFSRIRDYDAVYQVFRAELSGSFDTGGLAHRIIIGLDSDEFENDQFALRDRSTDQAINIFNPVYGESPESGLELAGHIDRIETQESTGLYVQDQISITDNFDLRLGLRYDDYQQEMINRRADDERTTQNETRLSPQLGFVYKTTDSISVYAAYGENFRPLSGMDAITEESFDPNDTTSAEIGVKFELNDGAISGNVALFTVEQGNITGIVGGGDWNAAALGEAESQGLEVDLNGEIVEGLTLWLSYAYVDAEVSNEFTEGNFGSTIPAGSPLINIPEQQLSIQLVQSTELSGRAFEFGGGLLYVGERNGYFGSDFELPSYTTVRVFAAHDVAENIELRLDVDNLFNEEYYSNSFSNTWVQPGTPTNARLSATYRF